MTNQDFCGRRVKRGFAAQRDELLSKLWMLNNQITHFIIAYQAGDVRVAEKRHLAEADREKVIAVLLDITREPKA